MHIPVTFLTEQPAAQFASVVTMEHDVLLPKTWSASALPETHGSCTCPWDVWVRSQSSSSGSSFCRVVSNDHSSPPSYKAAWTCGHPEDSTKVRVDLQFRMSHVDPMVTLLGMPSSHVQWWSEDSDRAATQTFGCLLNTNVHPTFRWVAPEVRLFHVWHLACVLSKDWANGLQKEPFWTACAD